VEYERNPRKNDHAVAQTAAAIEQFGFRVPILAKSDGLIVDGHLRFKAARQLGLATVPVLLADDMTEAQLKAFRLSVNKIADLALWDEELLALDLEDLQNLNFDMAAIGFSAEEIAALTPPAKAGLTDEDAVPDIQPDPITKPDDVWLLGNHRLMCGDATQASALERLCAQLGVDLLLTDPPYNVAYGGEKGNAANKNKVDGAKRNTQTILNDDMSDAAFRTFLTAAFAAAATVMKPGAVFYIWHSDTESYNFRGACKEAGLSVRQCLIWKKSSLVMGRQDYQWKHEPCLYGWKDGAAHLWATDRKQTTVLEFDRPSKSLEHPTMKPVALFEYQMLNNTKGADIVLDPFGGSGTTIMACEKHGRHARLLELDPKYCDVIIRRWQEFTGQGATLDGDGRTFEEITRERTQAHTDAPQAGVRDAKKTQG
jgi:site-specific DNA-methyltransferase (adenine-specific)